MTTMSFSREVRKVLARPEALLIGPVRSPVSGVTYPVYVAAKRMYTYPDTIQVLAKEMGEVVKRLGAKKIVGGETVGIILVTAISMATDIPMCYVRKEQRVPPRYGVEGVLASGEEVVLIDDSLVKGADKLKFIANIEAMGAKVTDIVTFLDVPLFAGSPERKMIAEKGIRCHSLGTWPEWFDALHEYGYLSDEMAKVAMDSANDILPWQGDGETAKAKWQWFETIKQAEGLKSYDQQD